MFLPLIKSLTLFFISELINIFSNDFFVELSIKFLLKSKKILE